MERTLEPEVMDAAEEAAAYAAMDHSGPNEAFVARLLELGAGAGGRMLDIGTGPAQIPRLLCERVPGARVVAIDLSRSMLEEARRELGGSEAASRVELRVADAKALEFPDADFDAVFSNTILHHIPDPLPFLAEAARVLRPGGLLLIRDLFRPDTPERVDELVALHAADATPVQRELFRASLCAALTPEELREVADRAGLADADVVVDTDRHVSLQRVAAPSSAT